MTSADNAYKVIEILMVTLISAIGFIPFEKRSEFLDSHQEAGSLLEGVAGIKIGGQKRAAINQLKLF